MHRGFPNPPLALLLACEEEKGKIERKRRRKKEKEKERCVFDFQTPDLAFWKFDLGFPASLKSRDSVLNPKVGFFTKSPCYT